MQDVPPDAPRARGKARSVGLLLAALLAVLTYGGVLPASVLPAVQDAASTLSGSK